MINFHRINLRRTENFFRIFSSPVFLRLLKISDIRRCIPASSYIPGLMTANIKNQMNPEEHVAPL
ncbi:MAG TPA: hypothetical protein DF409_01085 [Bacteroidales bacterium]|nr:hypothetical protein [Bacteroidales bacterium]